MKPVYGEVCIYPKGNVWQRTCIRTKDFIQVDPWVLTDTFCAYVNYDGVRKKLCIFTYDVKKTVRSDWFKLESMVKELMK